ncbi:2,3-bisphosphoglycerate-independent phosphoglycerate mutase [bacterium]|nr:2,3-bisphosphoglycerate-independent phosphoglycerate mutase [bacterium]
MNMKPLLLMILDGWGIRKDKTHNGIELAQKPFFDSLIKNYPNTAIDASGPAVGLPQGIMGNSEVGHMNLGAGSIVYTGLSQIYQAIENGSFFKNQFLLQAIHAVKGTGKNLHLMGLLSDGAVHSHQDHLYALIQMAKSEGVNNVFIHCFMDGRDTAPEDGIKYIDALEDKLKEIGVGKIASVCGRFYAMDRDKRWDRVEQAFDMLTGSLTEGEISAREIVQKSYDQNLGDEFIKPKVVLHNGKPVGSVQDGDAIIFYNFRADRAREISHALVTKNFDGFKRKKEPQLSAFVCMAPYDQALSAPVAFSPNLPTRIFPEIISEKGLRQLRIAETEKYAHVTFFFGGGREGVFKNEERVLIPSPREVATYDLKPEMSAGAIADAVIPLINEDKTDVVILNFANADMVGHTAKEDAIIRAITYLDTCIKKVVEAVLKKDGTVLVTADHGNSEETVDKNGKPHTAHTTNLVPFIVVSNQLSVKLKSAGGRLCDVAPTMLKILGIDKPKEMTGDSLIIN